MSIVRWADWSPASDATPVVDHVVHRDAERVLAALDDHAEAVADEHDVDSGLVHESCGRRVVRGDHRDALAAGLHPLKVQDRFTRHGCSYDASDGSEVLAVSARVGFSRVLPARGSRGHNNILTPFFDWRVEPRCHAKARG
jgi:hypothetical protein